MKQLKAWLGAWLLKLHEWRFHANPSKRPIGGLINWLFQIRLLQAAISQGVRVGFQGDSRFHEMELAINTETGWQCFAVSGSKADPDGLKWGTLIAAACRAPIEVIDWCGNDFLQGGTVAEVLKDVIKVREQMRLTGAAVLSIELCPLGLPADDPINQKIALFNAGLRVAAGADFIPLNDLLAPKGTMLPQYDCGDHIHWSEAAFPVIIARIKEVLSARGLA